jgi:hypothetical protein
MTPVRPEEKKKMAALVAGCVVTFALLIVRVMGAAGVSSSKAAPEVVLNSPASGVTSQPLSGAPAAKSAEMIPISNVQTGGADPFREIIKSETSNPVVRQVSIPSPGRIDGNVPVLPGPDGNGGFGVVDKSGSATPTPRSALVLMGVMVGKDSVAVFSVDGKDAIVRQGEIAVGKYRVARIGVAGVTLTDGKDKVELEVGSGVGDES